MKGVPNIEPGHHFHLHNCDLTPGLGTRLSLNLHMKIDLL